MWHHQLDPLTRRHSWDETRHCLDPLPRSDFFKAYCDRRRPELSLDRNPTPAVARLPVAVLSATGGRSTSSPCHSCSRCYLLVALRAAGRDHSRSRSMGELNGTSSHRTSPTLDENGSSLDWTCDMNCPMGGYAGMPRQAPCSSGT